ncbi:YhjD/YihY/BrkB family envelope integrity protein [Corynebacterium sp. L4756]|uniref:YhjD/YihY/BrkB family envelope integrity protein n=1 Tax=unclassified Corynebacterium TaxID=2624378 RepID=UPI00374CFA02
MVAATKPHDKRTDNYGIERSNQDDPGAVDKIRKRSGFVDHIMRMQERYVAQGGNQFSAGVTYYSVLAIFPIFMLTVAVIATVLANREDLMQQVQDAITEAVDGELGNTINEILVTAIDQRGAMFGVAGLTTLWSGLGWMNNLRIGISAMWGLDANEGGGNFVVKKLNDLVGLIGLLVAFIVAFAVTALGTSGIIPQIFDWMGIDQFPGMSWVIFAAGLAVGLLANFLVMWWLIVILPRTKVPLKSGAKGALLGAIALELIKQLSTVIISSATNNPAGAVFGPVIVLMVMMYLIWRIVMYVSAWTATTEEALALEEPAVPEPAVIRVRQEISEGPSAGTTFGIGAAIGAVTTGAVALWRRK